MWAGRQPDLVDFLDVGRQRCDDSRGATKIFPSAKRLWPLGMLMCYANWFRLRMGPKYSVPSNYLKHYNGGGGIHK